MKKLLSVLFLLSGVMSHCYAAQSLTLTNLSSCGQVAVIIMVRDAAAPGGGTCTDYISTMIILPAAPYSHTYNNITDIPGLSAVPSSCVLSQANYTVSYGTSLCAVVNGSMTGMCYNGYNYISLDGGTCSVALGNPNCVCIVASMTPGCTTTMFSGKKLGSQCINGGTSAVTLGFDIIP